MVDEEQLRKALPKLFLNGDPRYSKLLYEYQSKARKLRQIERKKPTVFNFHFERAKKVLDDFERALKRLEFEF